VDVVTGVDLLAAGVVVRRDRRGALVVYGPPERADLLDDLRFEVESRVLLPFEPPSEPPDAVCWSCGDGLGERQSRGLCVLCALAQQQRRRR
jgi:hypothetical protein